VRETQAGAAADRIRSVVERAVGPDPHFGPADAVAAIDPADIAHFLHPHFQGAAALERLDVGVAASPGAATGRVVTTASAALVAAERGQRVILVRSETGPEDVAGMQAAAGVLTARGGLSSHAAVVARGWGIPAVVGLGSLQVDAEGIVVAGRRITTGETISIDGHTGEVFAGAGRVQTADPPPELGTLLGWADSLRAGRFAIRANADDADTARHALAAGAEGIGLCRTEHMFLGPDRVPLVRRLILSDDPADDDEALAALEEVQAGDFEALFEVMDGRPVTVRLLDPPLHEFLPPIEPLLIAEARGELDAAGAAQLAALRRMREANPMLGTRGVRLGLVKPGLYPMQVRAALRAVASLRHRGRHPCVEIMIPLVADPSELRLARTWVETVIAEAASSEAAPGSVPVGTMIETPRAALMAGALARCADFFSFGTNDLTQLTFAFSRDDVETELLPLYLSHGLLAANPFDVLDEAGVGFLIHHAVREARASHPGLRIGACGEQAGDPRSARLLVASGLDYVSCSPYRLPMVRLAVAQALLDQDRRERSDLPAGAGPMPPTAGARGRPADDPGGAPGATAEDAFRILHALRIKGFAAPETLAEMSGVDLAVVTAELHRLAGQEQARVHPGRGWWQLTPAGRAHHATLLPGAPAEAIHRVRRAYERFLPLNQRFKELCGTWQIRDGSPNDHTDAGYDAGRIAALVDLHRQAEPVLAELAAGVERLGLYLTRLGGALSRLQSGETEAFTGVMRRSYHDVWMELHEDLLAILALDRSAEGSF
jgi:phosphoenolpyruvate-protein kinase (PTS system EI component)